MQHELNILIEKDSEGYLVASVPELPGCYTQAKTMDEVLSRIREAIVLCLGEFSRLSLPEFAKGKL